MALNCILSSFKVGYSFKYFVGKIHVAMEFSKLSAYEKEIINKIIPILQSDSTSLPLYIRIINIVYSDNMSLLLNHKLCHRSLGDVVSNVTQNVIEFLRENHFISKRADGSYTKEQKGDALIKAGSIESYLG